MDIDTADSEQDEETFWYVCLICHQAFKQEIQLKQHRKVNHTLKGPKSFLVLSLNYDLLPSINLKQCEGSRQSVGLLQRPPSPNKKCLENNEPTNLNAATNTIPPSKETKIGKSGSQEVVQPPSFVHREVNSTTQQLFPFVRLRKHDEYDRCDVLARENEFQVPNPVTEASIEVSNNYVGIESVLQANPDMPLETLEEAQVNSEEIILEINGSTTSSIVPTKVDRKKEARKRSTSKKKRNRKSRTIRKNESNHFQCKLCFRKFPTTGSLNSHVLIKHIPNNENHSDQSKGVENLKSEIKLENTQLLSIPASVQTDNLNTVSETNIEYTAHNSNNFEAVRIEEHVDLDNDGNIVLADKLKTELSPISLPACTEQLVTETICTKPVPPSYPTLRPRKTRLNVYTEENDADIDEEDLPINSDESDDDNARIEMEIESSSVSSDSDYEEKTTTHVRRTPARKRNAVSGRIMLKSDRKKNEIPTTSQAKIIYRLPITSMTKSIQTRRNGEVLYECKFCCCKYVNVKNLKLHLQDMHPEQYVTAETCSTAMKENHSQSEDDNKFSLPGSETRSPSILTTESAPSQTTEDPTEELSSQIQASGEDESNSTRDTTTEPDQNSDSTPNSEKESFDCGICYKLFDELDEMNQHILEIHRNHIINSNLEIPCDCLHCFKMFLIPLPSTLSYNGYKCKICCEIITDNTIKQHLFTKHSVEELSNVEPSKKEWFSKLQSVHGIPVDTRRKRIYPDPNFACKTCHQKFVYESNFVRHLCKAGSRNGTRKESFDCIECNKQYLSFRNLKIHQRTVHAPKTQEFVCSECGMKFNCSIYLKKHFSRCHEILDKIFECDICGRPFNMLKKVKNHRLSHNSVKPYLCSHCGRSFKSSHDFSDHVRIRHSGITFKCDKCDASFPLKVSLDRHSASHEGRPFKCSICGNSFKLKVDLKVHLKTHSTEPKFKACRICNQEFRGIISLRRHLVEVHNEKLSTVVYECEVCGQKFPQRFNLRMHMHLHSDIKTIECPTCSKMFKTKSNLKQHLTTHLTQDQMKYICAVCGKKFPLSATLRVHERIHTREPNKNKTNNRSRKKKEAENSGENQAE